MDNDTTHQEVSLEGRRTALDRNGNRVVKIGKYWFSTDFNRFWELLSDGDDDQIIYSYLRFGDRIYSVSRPHFKRKSRLGAAKYFEKMRMCFLDPEIQKVYQEGDVS
jgi:hypothetical protein